jgi:RNA polymerase sigma factor (sigma-70 family)
VADTQYPDSERFDTLSRVIRDVIRARRLSPEDADDLTQYIHLKLLERNYAVFERFSGRSSLRTYLTVVVNRLRIDWQRAARGKWHPSARARRLGPAAVDLDRLMYRDGMTQAEAIMTAQASGIPAGELARIEGQLTPRIPRRFVSDAVLDSIPGAGFDDPIERDQRLQGEAATRRELHAALRAFTADERRLIVARYVERQSVSALARELGVDRKLLYRRCDRLLRSLRRRLEGRRQAAA